MIDQLKLMREAIDAFSELKNQDQALTVEMSYAMLTELINTGSLRPMIEYVKQYCDVLDSSDRAEEMARQIAEGS